jgi:hypothetical protein
MKWSSADIMVGENYDVVKGDCSKELVAEENLALTLWLLHSGSIVTLFPSC